MIQILIEGREIELPADISFEYTVENRVLSNADGYSFDIEIPLKESAVNSDIFGMVFDPQADIETLKFQAQLITAQVNLSGVIAIVGVSESLLSIQFLEGKSMQNYDKYFEETYINELKLGTPNINTDINWSNMPTGTSVTPFVASIDSGANAVALPWVLSDSGEYLHNEISYSPYYQSFVYNVRQLEFMPYLLTVAKAICKAIGFEPDFSKWESSELRHLLVCNAMPKSMGMGYADFSWILPHWSVNEFFEKLEYLLGGDFDFNTADGKVSFDFVESSLESIKPVVIDQVVDEFDVEIDSQDPEEKSQDLDILKNLSYSDNGYRFWKIDSCDWYIRQSKRMDIVDSYHDLEHFLLKAEGMKYSLNTGDANKLYYVEDVDSYFVIRAYDMINYPSTPLSDEEVQTYHIQPGKWYYVNEVLPVNNFGDYIYADSDDAEAIQLDIVPVPLDEASGRTIFLPFKQADTDDSVYDEPNGNNIDSIRQPDAFRNIMAGDSSRPEFYDKLYIAIWRGLRECAGGFRDVDIQTGFYKSQIRGIFPDTSNVEVFRDFSYHINTGPNLRLNNGFSRGFSGVDTIEPKRLYKFSFLADTLPSARATFYIKGKRYICAKLTASFSADGMSKLVKGEFYRF